MDILKNFGVDPILLSAQIVNFLIILWLLKKFAYKPLFAMLAKRKKLIEESVANAEKTEELLKKTEDKEREIIKKAHIDAQAIIADAAKQAHDILSKAEESTKEKVQKLLDDGQKEIATQVHDAEKQLSQHTAELAVKLLEKSIGSLVDGKTQKEIIEKAASKLIK